MGRKEEPLALPHARTEGLVVEELPDEVLVYDLDRHKAHCLNKTAALIWKQCDGLTPVQDMAFILRDQLNTPIDEDVVWLSIEQLNKARLLKEPVRRSKPGLSRREVIRRAGLAAALSIPVVTTILAPTAFAALSCGQFSCLPSAPLANQCPTGSGCQCANPAAPCVASGT